MDRLTLVLVCMLCSAAASAGIITIKASDYVAGDNISNPNLDVVLSYRSTPKTPGLPEIIEPVLIEGSGDNLTFGTTFNIDPYARAIVRGSDPTEELYRALRIDFYIPADYVSIKSSYYVDGDILYAFDKDNNFLGTCGEGGIRNPAAICDGQYLHEGPGCNSYEGGACRHQIDFYIPGISYVIVGSWGSASQIDTISYRIPEPASIALLSLGLAGMVATRRRNSRA